jgi:hypothetical protein
MSHLRSSIRDESSSNCWGQMPSVRNATTFSIPDSNAWSTWRGSRTRYSSAFRCQFRSAIRRRDFGGTTLARHGRQLRMDRSAR